VPVMKVPITGGNISTGKTLAFAISGTTTRKVFTVVTVTAEAITVEVGITAEAEVTVVAVVTAAVVVTTEQALALFAWSQEGFGSTTRHRLVPLASQ
jgi:hypothetical protein